MECCIIRGGTSRGVFFNNDTFPFPRFSKERNEFLQRNVFGMPDESGLLIDGLGGGVSSNSKVVFVGSSKKPGFNLEYDFGQVQPSTGDIDWSGNCGNLASACLLFAKVCNLLPAHVNYCSIWQLNVQEKITITEKPNTLIKIPGIFGDSPAIELEFFVGDENKTILPTNNVIDEINQVKCSLILGSNPTVFCSENDPNIPKNNDEKDDWIEKTRVIAARKFNIPLTSALKIAFVRGNDYSYKDQSGKDVLPNDYDIFSKITVTGSSRRYHHAFTATGAVNLALCAKIKGTVVNQLFNQEYDILKLAHLGGIMNLSSRVNYNNNNWTGQVKVLRTARLIMKGLVY